MLFDQGGRLTLQGLGALGGSQAALLCALLAQARAEKAGL